MRVRHCNELVYASGKSPNKDDGSISVFYRPCRTEGIQSWETDLIIQEIKFSLICRYLAVEL